MSDLRYPIGQFNHSGNVSDSQLDEWITQIEHLPGELRRAVSGLQAHELDTPYREGGWTVRQVVHHLPDSHLNFYVRLKWALTEDDPEIRTYYEDRWAQLPDSREAEIEPAIELLAAIHRKLVVLLRSLSREQLSRSYLHPESGRTELAHAVGAYAWHGRHHLAHIAKAVASVVPGARQASRASVPTETPGRYIAQLCKHFAHKVPAEYEPRSFEAVRGRVEFPDAGVCTMRAMPNMLELQLVARDTESLHRLEGVVTRHLARFAWREPPVVEWTYSTPDSQGPQMA